MPPSKKKLLKLKEVSLDSPPKEETPNIELPNDENILFDVDDDIGTSTIADLSGPVKMKRKKSNPTMLGNMPLISYLNFLQFTLMGKASENGSNIKPWMIWNHFTNGMRNIWQLENLLHPILRTHGIKETQNS